MKSSLWSFANIASTVCVSDDASCEKIRVSLENCEVEKDIMTFIKTRGTGQEIPDPPRYVNFARGDVNETASEASEDENYSVAQFQRTVKPEYRSSSPNPSALDSHQEPQTELIQRMNGGQPTVDDDDELTPSKANSGRPPPLKYKQPGPHLPPNYSPSQHGDLAKVPHNEYPTDGMTMFCRAGQPSVAGSALSSNTRPSSRDSQSECSNPSSYTSAEPMSGKNSPTKSMAPVNAVQIPGMTPSAEKAVQKKRSGFFSNSPFRRKSKRETEHQAHTPVSNRNTWNPASSSSRINLTPSRVSNTSQPPSPAKAAAARQSPFNCSVAPEGEEPADPRASFQLNVGNNVFNVAPPDSQITPKAGRRGFPGGSAANDLGMDPIAQAIEDLKSSGGMSKQASMRMTADRYHGIHTPAPEAMGRSAPLSATSSDRLAAQRGTPPPAYDGPRGNGAPALGVPQPAFTSKEMRARTENWGTQNTYGTPGSREGQQQNRPGTSDRMRARSPGPGIPRAVSPQPMRARSPAPGIMGAPPPGQQYRAYSPSPFAGGGRPRAQTQSRQNSGDEMQLASQNMQRHDGYGSGSSRQGMSDANRPRSAYGVEPYSGANMSANGGSGRERSQMMDAAARRERSRSLVSPGQLGQGPPTGSKRILHYCKLPKTTLEKLN